MCRTKTLDNTGGVWGNKNKNHAFVNLDDPRSDYLVTLAFSFQGPNLVESSLQH